MLVVAGITMIWIVFSSFNFQNKQQRVFEENSRSSDSLRIMPLRVINSDSTITLSEWEGEEQLVVFWASWSDKSEALMDEITVFSESYSDSALQVVAALVMDVTESEPDPGEYPGFVYVDGTRLYNNLQVPGIPSYIYFRQGEVVHAHMGYQIGAGLDTLKAYSR